jgi:competence protein ComFC
MVGIKPIELRGNWAQGYALDIHTISAEYIGDDDYGIPRFDTKRTELGELVVRLKYRGATSTITALVSAASYFLLNKWGIVPRLDCIIPVPPSNTGRKRQPVIEIAETLSTIIGVPLCVDGLKKVKKTPELKEILECAKRQQILQDAFTADGDRLMGKSVLVFDDLYRSGATLRMITDTLYSEGRVSSVYVLTLTKTRANR